jgi:hypothetical protein
VRWPPCGPGIGETWVVRPIAARAEGADDRNVKLRLLGTWVAALLVAGSASALARAPHEPPSVKVSTDPGADHDRDRDRDWTAGPPPDADPSMETTTTAPPTSSTTRRPSTTTTAAPKASPLVAHTAVADQVGVWVVRKDGTGLRRVEAQCRNADAREWLSESELLLRRDQQQTLSRLRLDGSTTPLPPFVVTDPGTGQELTIQGPGTLSPDRRSMAIGFGGAGYGVAIVDLATGHATVTQSGDNPLPLWSPNGDILLVGSAAATLYGPSGVIRTTTPSPVSPALPWLQWSPSGTKILGVPMTDLNSWVLFDPHSGTSRTIPHLGPGGRNEVMWGDEATLVVGEGGVDHQIKPTTRAYDLATGKERVLAEAAHHPHASTASRLIAYEDATTYRTIGLVSLDGARHGDLVTTPADLWPSPDTWSPSGDLLMFNVCPSGHTSSGGLPST